MSKQEWWPPCRSPSTAWALTTVPVQAVKSLIVLRNDPAVRVALGHDELLPAPTLLHETRAAPPSRQGCLPEIEQR
jgi:hypothetical protein